MLNLKTTRGAAKNALELLFLSEVNDQHLNVITQLGPCAVFHFQKAIGHFLPED
jgi:hypothetical protein